MQTINPATGEPIRTYQPHAPAQVEEMLDRADSAFRAWKQLGFDGRGRLFRRLAAALHERRDRYGRLMTEEMGKPVTQARAEIDKCAWVCEYYADEAESFLTPEPVGTDAASSYVRYEPLGPVLAVMPWNFPFWQVLRFAAPALMAGNVALLKHAPNVPGCALAIERVFRECGFPEGVLQTLLVEVDKVPRIVADRRVRGVTLTGSVRAGSAVAELAGRAIKKSVLELGGSDPFIVLDDADLDRAARVGAAARTQNSGQSCIAAKRFIVVEPRHDEFVQRLRAEMEALAVGDPMDEGTQIGPLAREDLRQNLARQVDASAAAGARLALGGRQGDGPGFFYPPTMLTGVGAGMPAFDEELFGPAAAIVRVPDERAAVATANASSYGLGASIWSRDLERAQRLGAEIEAGAVFVNALVKSDPRVPFGGVKDSGFGRELSLHGIREFVNVKTVWVEAS